MLIKKMRPGAIIPKRTEPGSAGYDLYASLEHGDNWIPAGEWRLIPTGVAMSIPLGFEGQVRPRSGMALKHGVTVLNSPGTIDPSYTGEIGVILINHGNATYVVKQGDRIAQLVIAAYGVPMTTPELEEVDSLEETVRGANGFGSSGI